MTVNIDVDVAIVGAGPTGAFAGLKMAKAGLKVLLVDRKNFGQTGAQWINDVPEWMLKEVGFTELSKREVFGKNEPLIVFSPCEKARLGIKTPAMWSIDMRGFGERLLEEFMRVPRAMFLSQVDIKETLCRKNGRLSNLNGVIIRDGSPENIHINAQLFVDASGLKGVIRKQVPMLSSLCPAPPRHDLCSAAQEVYSIKDVSGAQEFLRKKNAMAGDMIAYLGVAGGFSLMRIHIAHDFSNVAFLTGAISLPEIPSGQQLINNFIRENSWVDKRLFGGSRAIPLRGPYAALAASGVALLGDAASQVFGAHGSGVGIGLLAGLKLAECVTNNHHNKRDIGELQNLWEYPHSFHKNFGALLHGADLFRRFSQSLDKDELLSLMKSGLISEHIFHNGLTQQNAWPAFADMAGQFLAGLKNPRLVRRLAPVVSRLFLIALTAPRYPTYSEHWQRSVINYERRMAGLCDVRKR